MVFKESEVMICDKNYTRISARNRFISRISRIETDEIFARIHFEFHGANLSALISREAKEDLNLRENEEIAWFVKSSEVALEF